VIVNANATRSPTFAWAGVAENSRAREGRVVSPDVGVVVGVTLGNGVVSRVAGVAGVACGAVGVVEGSGVSVSVTVSVGVTVGVPSWKKVEELNEEERN